MKVTGRKKPKHLSSKEQIKGIQASTNVAGLTEENIQQMNKIKK